MIHFNIFIIPPYNVLFVAKFNWNLPGQLYHYLMRIAMGVGGDFMGRFRVDIGLEYQGFVLER